MSRLTSSVSTLTLLVSALGLGCGAESSVPVVTPKSTTPTDAKASPATASVIAKKAFENPGGMWVPSQLADHGETLKNAGLELDPKTLTDPTAPPLGAVVSLGGCSASFVSPDGLIVTNHHCVTRILQFNSTPEKNLANDGYIAKTRADEKWAGPTNRVFVTQSFKDVTTDMRAGLDTLPNDRARFDKLEERQKSVVAACEKGRPEVRCTVKDYFGGAQYLLIEQLELRDVRLVYAPPESVGQFGGEIDNWRWPRHGADVSFLRAYVNKDNKPADHAETNVPYKPPHYLRMASKPLVEGDFVLVAGYPGKTNRLRTALEVRETVDWDYPRRIQSYEQGIAALEALVKQQPKLNVKISPLLGFIGNALTRTKGLSEGLGKGGIALLREKEDAALAAWIDADAQRKATYGDMMGKMSTLVTERKKTREEDMGLMSILQSAEMFSAAMTIVRMAEERDKPDAARDPDYQERNWKRLEQRLVRTTSSYDRAIDQTLVGLILERMSKLTDGERPAFVSTIVGKKLDRPSIDKALADLYKTNLEDEKTRLELLRKAKTAELAKSKDPMLKLAVALRPVYAAMEAREKSFEGAMSMLRPRYFEALQKMRAVPIAPDANSTLRVSYGTVRGYRPTTTAPMYRPFTTLSEMAAKVTDKEPFNAPKRLVDAARAKKVGTHTSAALGEVPVNFLSDVDTTGGNSGSPTLNARGELVGLLFDGNYESMASDVVFLPEVTRAIHVDFRYVQWVLDVDGADNVLTELGVKPSVD